MARRSIKARLKETPWMVVLILFLILIIIVAMWGKLPWRGTPHTKTAVAEPTRLHGQVSSTPWRLAKCTPGSKLVP
jgi:hypothetical protein